MASPEGSQTDSAGNRTYPSAGPDRFPSVTTILSMINKPAIAPWMAKEAGIRAVNEWELIRDSLAHCNCPVPCKTKSQHKEIVRKWVSGAAREKTDAAGVRGSAVHDLAEKAIKGEILLEEDSPYLPYVNGYRKFCEDHNPEFHFTERTFVDPDLQYAGTADFGASLWSTFGSVVIGDWKTSASGPYLEWAYQLSAYVKAKHILVHKCLECRHHKPSHKMDCSRSRGYAVVYGDKPAVSQDKAAIVRLLPDRYELYWVGEGRISLDHAFAGFKAALTLYRLKQAAGKFDKEAFTRG